MVILLMSYFFNMGSLLIPHDKRVQFVNDVITGGGDKDFNFHSPGTLYKRIILG
jgi:hypothetical protein